MDKIFKSRGIRIVYKNNMINCEEKIYYEPDQNVSIENNEICQLEKNNLISLFEYSMIGSTIDTYNFHVSLYNDKYKDIYRHLPSNITLKLMSIENCFNTPIKNYTVGYKLYNQKIVKESYYFYPVIDKGDRYGIQGITNKFIIKEEMQNFCNLIASNNKELKNIILEFSNLIYKFKGISVHIVDSIIGYKIYGRIEYDPLRHFLLQKFKYNINYNEEYGDCVLAALRIHNNKVEGINIYYVR